MATVTRCVSRSFATARAARPKVYVVGVGMTKFDKPGKVGVCGTRACTDLFLFAASPDHQRHRWVLLPRWFGLCDARGLWCGVVGRRLVSATQNWRRSQVCRCLCLCLCLSVSVFVCVCLCAYACACVCDCMCIFLSCLCTCVSVSVCMHAGSCVRVRVCVRACVSMGSLSPPAGTKALADGRVKYSDIEQVFAGYVYGDST
jgi:hypothetical protein